MLISFFICFFVFLFFVLFFRFFVVLLFERRGPPLEDVTSKARNGDDVVLLR